MTVYVDRLRNWGWTLRGHATMNCHMFTDQIDLTELHQMAQDIGMKRAWFQDKPSLPHYDLTASRRELAVEQGAIELDDYHAVAVWRARRFAVIEQRFITSRQEYQADGDSH